MIRREDVTTALERLDARDREVLDLSLRRRVPDEDLATVLACETPEVARRRAGAVERLSDELGIQRGVDLGAMLKALLEAETWAPVDGAEAAPPPEGPPPAEAAEPAPEPAAEEAPEPAPETTVEPEPAEGAPESAEGSLESAEAVAASAAQGAEPFHETLARAEPGVTGARPRARTLLAGAAIGALFAVGGFLAATMSRDDGSPERGEGSQTRHFVPQPSGPLAAPFPSDPAAASCYATAHVTRATTLHTRPGGRRKLRIPARTEWESPRVLSVVRQRGRWIAVLAPELRNGEVGWMRAERARLDCVNWSLHVDLSRRVLLVRRDGRTVRRMGVAIGARRHPTPTGRFAVTDRLKVTDEASPYGCCVLALTGHQTRLPPDWPGGDRLAVHATSDRSSIGRRVSLGCMRATPAQSRWLIETVPLGAPVFIRS